MSTGPTGGQIVDVKIWWLKVCEEGQPLRLGRRDDGLGGTSGHPRLSAAAHPTSAQGALAPRVGGANTYS